MICRRPRVLLEENIEISAEGVAGRFAIMREERKEFHSYLVPNRTGARNPTISCPYPYSYYRIYDERGNELGSGVTSLFVSLFKGVDASLFGLEVLYIGQAFGREGNKFSAQRLKNHSTLQEIYLDAIQKNPDQEIWLVLCECESTLLMSIDPTSPRGTQSDEDDNRRTIDMFSKMPIREALEINFTEAGLIRYFEPQYNVHYKSTFPSPSHESYGECYELDFNSISIDVDTENLKCALWTQTIPQKFSHLIRYPLHDSKVRRDMFDFAGLKPR